MRYGANASADLKDDANNRGDQSIADAISEQITDPPDEPFEDDEEAYSDLECYCGNDHSDEEAMSECARSHV